MIGQLKHNRSKITHMPRLSYLRPQKLSVRIKRKAPELLKPVTHTDSRAMSWSAPQGAGEQPRAMGLSEVQGASEKRTEMYGKYFEGASQLATPQFAKSIGRVPGLARKQANAAHNSSGMASIVAVGVMMILVTLIALGFARIMDRAAVNSQLHQASSTATYAAQSALNDIATYIKTNPTAYSKNCVGSNSLIGSATSPGPFYNDANLGGGTDRNVQYTCLLLNQTPADLAYQALPSGGSRVVKATTSAFPGSLDKMMISWQPTNGQITGFPPTGNQLFDESTWSSLSNNYVPMLRVTLYPVSDTNSLASVQANSKTVFLYPQAASGTVPAPNYASLVDGSILPVPCTSSIAAGDFNGTADYTCNIIIGNLATTTQPDAISYFYLRLTPIYGQADIKIKANDMWGQSVNFVGVQAIVDATAKVGNVAKRLQARLDIGGVGQSFDGNISPYSAAVPEYSVRTADALCKRFQHYTPDSTNYFYDFVSLDPGTQDSVCHTGLVTNAPALTLSITGGNGQDSGISVDSQANNPDSPQNPVQKGTVYVDSAARVNWQSTDAAYNCNASGGWSGNKNTISSFSGVTGTGSQNFSGITNYTTYSMTCSGPGGTTSPKSVTLWPPPQVNFSGSTDSYNAGSSYTIKWNSANANKCVISSSGNEPWNQTYTSLSPTGDTRSNSFGTSWSDQSNKSYSITCYDPSGRSASASWSVGRSGNTVTNPPTCTATANFSGSTTDDATIQWYASCPEVDPGGGGSNYYIDTNVPNIGSGYTTAAYRGGTVRITQAGSYHFTIYTWAPGWYSAADAASYGNNNGDGEANSGTQTATVVRPFALISFYVKAWDQGPNECAKVATVPVYDQGTYNCRNNPDKVYTPPIGCPDGNHRFTVCSGSSSTEGLYWSVAGGGGVVRCYINGAAYPVFQSGGSTGQGAKNYGWGGYNGGGSPYPFTLECKDSYGQDQSWNYGG